jgi:hypothetical protein
MKPFITALALALCAVAAVAQPSQSSAPSATSSPQAAQDPNAEKARAILDRCIQTLGGQAWLNVQDMEQQGRSYAYSHNQPSSLGTVFWRFWKYPDKDRVELTKQRDVVYLNVGDQGYEITFKGTGPQEEKPLADYNRRRAHSLETVLRDWLKRPGTALFYDGTAVAEQKPADSVTILNAENDSVTLFIDTHSHLPIKKTFEWRDPADRLKNIEGEVFDNWRLEQGIMTPHSIMRSHNGETTNQRFITTVRYNVGIPDSMFQAAITYDPNKPPTKKR